MVGGAGSVPFPGAGLGNRHGCLLVPCVWKYSWTGVKCAAVPGRLIRRSELLPHGSRLMNLKVVDHVQRGRATYYSYLIQN